MIITDPAAIEARSMEIIESELKTEIPPENKAVVKRVESMNLAELFIVSKCLIADDEDVADEQHVTGRGAKNPGLEISVSEAPGVKCPRCWMHSEDADPETGLCPRCAAVVAKR